MLPPTGMEDDMKPMTAEQRMQARFPQNVRVGDLIGLPVLDESSSTLGHVSEVVRTPSDKIELIVAYGGFLGWGTRPVAVPIEVVGIQGREVASLDMPPNEYAKAPTWHEAVTPRPCRITQQSRSRCPGAKHDAGARDHEFVKAITFWCATT